MLHSWLPDNFKDSNVQLISSYFTLIVCISGNKKMVSRQLKLIIIFSEKDWNHSSAKGKEECFITLSELHFKLFFRKWGPQFGSKKFFSLQLLTVLILDKLS